MADDSGGQQREIDFVRAEQLRILRDCELPKDAKDAEGKGVSANVLKGVLNAIDHYGRGRRGGAYASVATLARAANVGKRTATRAIAVLVSLGVVCVTNDGPRWGSYGSPTNCYTIVWSELAILVDRQPLISPLARLRNCADHSATGADHSATGADHSATGADHSATGGALSAQETYMKRRLNVQHSDGAGRDGAKEFRDEGSLRASPFSEEELAGVRFKANTIDKWIAAKEPGDRQLVLKIAVLWHDGELPDDCVEQVLESFRRKRELGVTIERPCGWLWTALRAQAAKHGVRLEQLLARTRWPEELLTLPRERSTAPT